MLRTFLAGLLALGLSACGDVARPVDPLVALEACRVEGVRGDARCGTLAVPEDRAQPSGKRITLHYAVLPARSRSKEPDPVFIIAGGPGQSAIAVAAQLMPTFAKLHERRDIVFLDQRGTGESNPLSCDVDAGEADVGLTLDAARQKRLLQDCLAALPGDPRHYTTPAAVADLDALRSHLGYEVLNLWGASYGTRVALEYLRRHESAVRSVVLDGVAPQAMKLPQSFAEDGHLALRGLLARCAGDPACARAYPDLSSRLDAWLVRLGSGNERYSLTHPLTARPEASALDAAWLRMALFRPLYLPQLTSLLPGALHAGLKGELAPLLALNLGFMGGGADLALGMHYAVICSEDVAAMSAAEVKALGNTFFGEPLTRGFIDLCADWPKAVLPADYAMPVRSSKPVLILSGGRDPATPPRHGKAVAVHLPRSRHLIAPELGHGVSSTVCASDLITRFVRAADASGLDDACLKRLPAVPIQLPMRAEGGRP
jgi:pimeloyl-ACP methyl ester carboxylesterase